MCGNGSASTVRKRWSLPAACLLAAAGGGCNEPEMKRFSPPSQPQREQAIGDTRGLSDTLKRAFTPDADFEPIRPPGSSDWLARHPEAGQTFDQFVAAKPNRPDRVRRTLYLLPLGQFGPDRGPPLADLEEFAQVFFGLPVKRLDALELEGAGLTTRTNVHTAGRQFLTGDILRLLEDRLPRDAYCLVGLTMDDLYPEESWNFVFGQASLARRVGVWSFARYDPAFYGDEPAAGGSRVLLLRSAKVLAHETCHMFGMRHCIYFECLVNGSNHLAESDARPLHLCPVCLRKLQWSTRFDVVDRYRKLKTLYERFGFDDEAAWIDGRFKRIGQ